MKEWLFWLGLCLCLAVPNAMVFWKEQSLHGGGRIVYLQLAPRDPRSLMQGDYMALDYALTRPLADPSWPERGTLRAEIDGRGVITGWSRSEGPPLLRYHVEKGHLIVASQAYHFEEGQGERYRSARYGQFHLSADGTMTLRALADDQLEPL